MSPVVEEIEGEIQEALRMFGEYTYEDKGAREVMDIYEWTKRFKELGPQRTGEVLKELVETSELRVLPFVRDVLGSLDTWGDDNWEVLMKAGGEKVEDCY